MKIARIAVEANRRMGKTRDQVRSEADVPKFQMPGAVQKENLKAIANANVKQG